MMFFVVLLPEKLVIEPRSGEASVGSSVGLLFHVAPSWELIFEKDWAAWASVRLFMLKLTVGSAALLAQFWLCSLGMAWLVAADAAQFRNKKGARILAWAGLLNTHSKSNFRTQPCFGAQREF